MEHAVDQSWKNARSVRWTWRLLAAFGAIAGRSVGAAIETRALRVARPRSPARARTARPIMPPVCIANRSSSPIASPGARHRRGCAARASRLRAWRASAFSAAASTRRIAAIAGSALPRCARLGLDEVWWLVSPGNPLKAGAKDMAPFDARLASAKAMARRAPIRASDFERQLGTRYTIDTVRALKRAATRTHRFIWLLGSDTLPDFHKWRDWRDLARMVPIAVMPRPGYDRPCPCGARDGLAAAVRPSARARRNSWTDWSAPAILFLRLPQRPHVRHRHSRAQPPLASPLAQPLQQSAASRRQPYRQ